MVVGVNQFQADDPPRSMPSPDYATLADQQLDRVRTTRAGRDDARCRTAIEEMGEGARGDVPLMPLIINAVRARATVGEISDALRESWGVYHPA